MAAYNFQAPFVEVISNDMKKQTVVRLSNKSRGTSTFRGCIIYWH